MAELPEPEATGSNLRVKLVIGVVVVLVLYLIGQSVYKAQVVKGLASKDAAVRKTSALKLMGWKTFTDVLSRQTVPVKRPMIVTLKEMGTADAAGELIALMKDRNPTVQNEAQFALFHMQPTSIPKLVDALKNADLNVKNRAALLLIQIGRPALDPGKDADGKEAAPPLLNAVSDGGQRAGVTRVVSALVTGAGTPQAQEDLRAMVVPWLVKKLSDEKADAATKACAVDILGRINAQSAAAQIRGLLNAEKVDAPVRKAVLIALGRLRHADAFGLLQEALGDKDSSLQNTAIVGMGELHNPQAVSLLQPFLTGYDESLRDAAVAALTKIGPPAIVALQTLLKHERYEVRVGALRGLEGIDDPRVPGVIAGALQDRDENVRWQAAEALGRPGDARGVAPLLRALSDPSWRVGSQARDSLARVGKPSVPGLAALLGGSGASTAAYYAQGALEKIGADAVPALLAAAQSGSVDARARAVLALGSIGDHRAQALLTGLEAAGPAELRSVARRALDQLSRGHRVSS